METRSVIFGSLVSFVLIGLVGCGVARVGSPPPQPLGGANDKLFVVSSDFQKTGTIRFLKLSTGEWLGDPLRINSDAMARYLGLFGEVWVLNRFGADNLQPVEKNLERTRPERKVGNLTDLQDVVDVSANRLLVASQASPEIWEIDTQKWEKTRGYSFEKVIADDGELVMDIDGSPEPGSFWKNDDEVWVQLRRLDRNSALFDPRDRAYIAVLDTQMGTIRSAHKLAATNPTADLKTDVEGNLYVAQAGYVGQKSQKDGLIEKWDPKTYKSLGAVVTEAKLGGDIVDFEILSDTLGVAIVASPNSKLVRFNPKTGEVIGKPLSESPEYAYFQVLADRGRGVVYLVDRTSISSRIRVFDVANAREVGPGIDPGLPAFQIGFVP
jgi:hypothetical protein